VTPPTFNVGAYVRGATDSPRVLVRRAELMAAYADGAMAEKGEDREGYLSHFAYGPEMEAHFAAKRGSVADYEGPCWCRWLVFDIDRDNLVDALADARKLVAKLTDRYPEVDGHLPVYFSGSKGFHVLLGLAHAPPPAVGFHRVCRTLAELLAKVAGVTIDTAIYDVNRLMRLPNTRHPRTGLFKRCIDVDALFRLDIDGIRKLAEYSAGDGLPSARTPDEQLADDWAAAVRMTENKADDRVGIRRSYETSNTLAPRYFLEFIRFGVEAGERHSNLFRCAAWLAEQKDIPSLCYAILTEPGRDLGLTPKDVERQIRSGMEHAQKQQRRAEGGPA